MSRFFVPSKVVSASLVTATSLLSWPNMDQKSIYGGVVGVHVRHGDKVQEEAPYIPITAYADAVKQGSAFSPPPKPETPITMSSKCWATAWSPKPRDLRPKPKTTVLNARPDIKLVYLATDSPSVIASMRKAMGSTQVVSPST